jgi:hypothetical protein
LSRKLEALYHKGPEEGQILWRTASELPMNDENRTHVIYMVVTWGTETSTMCICEGGCRGRFRSDDAGKGDAFAMLSESFVIQTCAFGSPDVPMTSIEQ